MSDVKPVAWNRYALYVGWRNDLERQKNKHGEWVKYADALATETALQAEIEALRKDAERYRWLCGQDDSAAIQVLHAINWTNVAACCALTFQGGKPEIDEAVDAAIAKEKQP